MADVIEENGNRYRVKNGVFEVREQNKKNYRKINESDVPPGVRARLVDTTGDTVFGGGGGTGGQQQQQKTTGKRPGKRDRAGHKPLIRPSNQYSRKVQKDLSFKGTVREFDIVETTNGKPAPADKIINVYYDSIRVYDDDKAYEVDKEQIRNALYGTISRVDEKGKPVFFPHQARWAAQEAIARSPKGGERGYSERDTRLAREMQYERQAQKVKIQLEDRYPGAAPTDREIEAIVKNKGVVPPKIDSELRRRMTRRASPTAARRAGKKSPATRKKAPTRACKSGGKKKATVKTVRRNASTPKKTGKGTTTSRKPGKRR